MEWKAIPIYPYAFPISCPITDFYSMFKSFSRGSIVRLAKCPFFNLAHPFSFRDAVNKKNDDKKTNKELTKKKEWQMQQLEEHLPEELL